MASFQIDSSEVFVMVLGYNAYKSAVNLSMNDIEQLSKELLGGKSLLNK